MNTTTAKGAAAAEKEANARSRACFNEEVTHVRLGDWRSDLGTTVTLVGTAAQLHGTLCTCCPRRAA